MSAVLAVLDRRAVTATRLPAAEHAALARHQDSAVRRRWAMRPDTPVDLVLERLQVERAAAVLAALARKPAAEPFLPVLVTDPRATVAAAAAANPCASDDQVAGVLHRLLPSEQALRELTVTVRRLAVTGMLEYYPQTVTAAVTHGTAGMLDAIVPHLISAEDNRRAAGRLVEELIRQRAPVATVYAWSATDDAAQLLYEAGTAAYEDGLLDDPVYAPHRTLGPPGPSAVSRFRRAMEPLARPPLGDDRPATCCAARPSRAVRPVAPAGPRAPGLLQSRSRWLR